MRGRGRDDDGWVWPLGALAILALWGRRAAAGPRVLEVEPDGLRDGGWVWPVPDLLIPQRSAARSPVVPGPVRYPAAVSQEFRRPDHVGLDLMYRRQHEGDLVHAFPPGKLEDAGVTGRPAATAGDATGRWFAPPGTPICAARDGILWSCEVAKRGWTIVLDHRAGSLASRPFATFYTHLESVKVPLAQRGFVGGKLGQVYKVKAGDLLGSMGGDPLESSHLRHLHFAVWYQGAGDTASVDPQGAMEGAAGEPGWRRWDWLVPGVTGGGPTS